MPLLPGDRSYLTGGNHADELSLFGGSLRRSSLVVSTSRSTTKLYIAVFWWYWLLFLDLPKQVFGFRLLDDFFLPIFQVWTILFEQRASIRKTVSVLKAPGSSSVAAIKSRADAVKIIDVSLVSFDLHNFSQRLVFFSLKYFWSLTAPLFLLCIRRHLFLDDCSVFVTMCHFCDFQYSNSCSFSIKHLAELCTFCQPHFQTLFVGFTNQTNLHWMSLVPEMIPSSRDHSRRIFLSSFWRNSRNRRCRRWTSQITSRVGISSSRSPRCLSSKFPQSSRVFSFSDLFHPVGDSLPARSIKLFKAWPNKPRRYFSSGIAI